MLTLSPPWITTEVNRQLWRLEECEQPNRCNSFRRKDIYKRFWTMLFARNVWRHKIHGIKTGKGGHLRGTLIVDYTFFIDGTLCQNVYVIDLVRTWLPNLPERAETN